MNNLDVQQFGNAVEVTTNQTRGGSGKEITLFSYDTKVAVLKFLISKQTGEGNWYYWETPQFYSRTTTKHISDFQDRNIELYEGAVK